MKKLASIICLILLITGFTSYFNGDLTRLKTQLTKDEPPQKSKEELYQDIFVTLLSPHIDKAIEDYYGKSYQVAPYNTEVLKAERPKGYRTFVFRIKLKVMPYTGPHITVGEDHITFLVSSGQKVKLEEFKHVKTYALPPRYGNN